MVLLVTDPSLADIMAGSTDVAVRGLRLHALVHSWQEAFTAIERYPMPVLAAVDGACIGAGMFVRVRNEACRRRS